MVTLTQGETLTLTETVADATAVEVRYGGPKAGSVSMAADGTTWAVNIDTAAFEPGQYVAQLWATYAGSIKRVVSESTFRIRGAMKAGDMRSQARIALDSISAMLAGQANEGVRRYRINNRELERYTVDELLKLRSHFAAEVLKEERRAKGLNSLGPRIAVHL
jgi:hypothetical protein